MTPTTDLMPLLLSRTPPYVWAILIALLVLGGLQARDHVVSRGRLLALPIAMAVLSLSSAGRAFHWLTLVPLVWAAGAAAGLAANRALGLPRRVQALGHGRWAIGGSWAPMALLLAIFGLRYAVAASLTTQPALAEQLGFVIAASAAYGLASGLLAARALRVLQHRAAPSAGLAAA